ncbi:unnamed protein product [Ilex paraguariensis]|uniref:Uncharacterized protein n=1 Tax=Ilex paraguariensis TaxID=185542 RepID=A0ABC8RLP2_9AQUA
MVTMHRRLAQDSCNFYRRKEFTLDAGAMVAGKELVNDGDNSRSLFDNSIANIDRVRGGEGLIVADIDADFDFGAQDNCDNMARNAYVMMAEDLHLEITMATVDMDIAALELGMAPALEKVK